MKILMSLLAVLTLAGAAYAATPTIKITSWQAVGNYDSQLGEVCGVVTGNGQTPALLEVIADYNTRNAAAYHTFAGTNGAFCEVVRTLVGSVQVNLVGSAPGASVTSRMTR